MSTNTPENKDFKDLQILTQKELITGALHQFLDSYTELRRREDITTTWLKSLCTLSLETTVWYMLFESGGAQRFTDILKAVDCSRATLSRILPNLLNANLIRMVDGRYQAIAPAWMTRRPPS